MTEVYEELRPLLFSIAYRMLGSASEAEDIVQEAFLRFHEASKGEKIDNVKAYLSTITTRLSIDHLRSARVRRETYVGPWLPEPLLTDQAPDASQHAEMADSMSMAFLVLLESLSPVERAVFLLREVFDYSYDEIAETIGKPGAVARYKDGRVASVISLQIAEGQVVSLRSVVNPDKLAHLGPVVNLYEVMNAYRDRA